ncbi:MAG: ProQ/FINO family protein [Thiolinea sp.]
MSDQPRKRLSLKKHHSTAPKPEEGRDVPVSRTTVGRKQVVRRDATTADKRPGNRPAAAGKGRPASRPPARKPPQARERPPSELQADLIDASLKDAFVVWSEFRPLALGVDQTIFDYASAQGLEVSRRVVQKLLHRHTHDQRYLENVHQGETRYHLDGNTSGPIMQTERDHAQRTLR